MKTMHEFLNTLHSFPRFEQEQVWASFRRGDVATSIAKLQEYVDERKLACVVIRDAVMQDIGGYGECAKPMQNACDEPKPKLQAGYYWVRDAKSKAVYIDEWSYDCNCWHWFGVSGTDKLNAVEVVGPVAELNQDQKVSIETALQRGYSATEFTLPYNWNMFDTRTRAQYVRWLEGQIA
jgi:hypothetical protein